ncbi:VWA domain-containing protein [Aquabacterium sp.]|uniref:nitric oxide reductase activation protein NorD n=1 Tax=Aquabacterium sp. TaxID=1872578 RepID=UPI0025C604CF|nr:VWA domain-containing protein [Aquabacterium sp.]
MRLLAGAVVGRPVSITYLQQVGGRSWSDGERIYLAAHEHEHIADRRIELMVQAALVAGHSLDSRQMRPLIGRLDLTQRYLVLEVERCCRLIQDRLPSDLCARLLPYRTGQQPGSAAESLAIARSRAALPTPPPWFGMLRPWRMVRKGLQGSESRLTEQKLSQLESALKDVDADGDHEDDEDRLHKSRFWQIFSSPFGRDSFFSRFMQEVMDMKSSPDKNAADSGVDGSSELVSGRLSKHIRDITQAIRSSMAVAIPGSFVAQETGAHTYPEWDSAAQRYRPHWVSVEEVDPHAEEPQFDLDVLHRQSERALQRSLASLCLGFQRHRDQPQGDDLVLDRMIRLAVDLQSGHCGDERVYAANLRTRRDLGVQILIDASSSTLERGADGQRVFERHVQAAWLLCRSMSLLGDRVALHAFNSWGRSLVRFQPVKTFDEPLGALLAKRLRQVAVAGYTRCGAAIRHATAMLAVHSGTPYKLLLLISDGYPYDDQYEGEYAIDDTLKAIQDAREAGVAVVCLSVGGDADAKQLERVYGATNYLGLERPEQMCTRLCGLIERALGEVGKVAV